MNEKHTIFLMNKTSNFLLRINKILTNENIKSKSFYGVKITPYISNHIICIFDRLKNTKNHYSVNPMHKYNL